ncbi:MAG: peptidylprolyl isomerase [Acetobacteraceae bacterium]|nr:MAG: peptidylprolyl isomerase [Acetobacteraceae bacterium]
MMKRSGFWSVLAVAAVLSGPALAEGETADTVVATVNGTKITLGQMVALKESLPAEYQGLPDDVLFKGIYDQLIQQEVLAQSFKDLSPRALATLENEKRGYVSGLAIDGIVKEAVTDEALQKAYDERFKDAKPQTEYSAAHILVDTEEEALKIKEELAAGGDFAEIAKAKSTDSGSGANGGDLGWFGLGMMVKPFEDAVVGAKVGEVTGPVKTDFGYHLIVVKESRVAEKPTLDQLRDELAQQVENAAITAKIDELTKGATVTRDGEGLDPAILKNSALID